MKKGDRVRVTGRKHPWKGASGVILREHAPGTWLLRLDAPWGFGSYGRESCALKTDVRSLAEEAATGEPHQPSLFEMTAATAEPERN